MRKLLLILCPLVIVFTAVLPALAQGTAYAELSSLRTDSFPHLEVSMDVFDGQGAFISGLVTENVSLFEDDIPQPVEHLQEVYPGVQLVVAVNPGSFFASRDEQAVSNYERIVTVLTEWAQVLPTAYKDDLSFLANGITGIWHIDDPQEWLTSLQAYKPENLNPIPNLDILSLAIETAGDPLPRPGMKRAVLYITSLPTAEEITTLYNLAEQAASRKIRVFVWIVEPPMQISSAVTAIKDLAIITGGQSFFFTGVEQFPEPEEYLSPLRHTYILSYTSGIRTTGTHTLAVQVATSSGFLIAQPLTFDLIIQPPNPIFVALPGEIIRQSLNENTRDPQALTPSTQTIEIIVEFPDGLPRPLVRTALSVDGQIVVENTSEPFDFFTWDLSSYDSSGQHVLQVIAVDDLGFENTSTSIPVQVTVILPEQGLLAGLKRNSGWFVGGAILLAGGTLTWVLISAGKKRRPKTDSQKTRGAHYQDPVTQPVTGQVEKEGIKFPWMSRARHPIAHLVRWKGEGKPVTAPPIPLTAGETTFGGDPTMVTHLLTDPSVSALHASIQKTQEDNFLLKDCGSIAGTWVNLQPVPESGYTLQHGDVIHIGGMSFRFLLRKPPEIPKPRLVVEAEIPEIDH